MERGISVRGPLVEEYRALVYDAVSLSQRGTRIDWGLVETWLQRDAAWTAEGARHVTELARQYGVFVLRNAVALAIALDIEDGELGL